MTRFKELSDSIQTFAQSSSFSVREVMSDLLKYIIGNFNPLGKPDPTWKHDREANKEFHMMMTNYFLLMDEATRHHSWFDAWGDLFMSLTPKGGLRGQFFTPSNIADLMTQITIDGDLNGERLCKGFGRRVVISDPAAGSGRNLLSAHVKMIEQNKEKPYLIAEDIDLDCCRMSAVNMMVHGCFGEVVCHDTLAEPNGLRVGFIVNEGLYPFPNGFPTIRESSSRTDFVSLM